MSDSKKYLPNLDSPFYHGSAGLPSSITGLPFYTEHRRRELLGAKLVQQDREMDEINSRQPVTVRRANAMDRDIGPEQSNESEEVKEQVIRDLATLIPRLRLRNPSTLPEQERFALLRTRINWLTRGIVRGGVLGEDEGSD